VLDEAVGNVGSGTSSDGYGKSLRLQQPWTRNQGNPSNQKAPKEVPATHETCRLSAEFLGNFRQLWKANLIFLLKNCTATSQQSANLLIFLVAQF
jgi:hypothetical protein